MLRILAALTLSPLLVACGSTSQLRQPVEPVTAANAVFVVGKPVNAVAKESDQPPDHFLNAIASYLKNGLAKSGRLAKEGENALTIDIKVTEYRMRSGFTRQMFGVLAGKDGIASEIAVRDASGKMLGNASVSTYNVLAIGGEEDVARMHGEEISRVLLQRLNSAQEAGR